MSPKATSRRTQFEERVYALCRMIPRGKVSTYADIATALGNRGLARAVGNALCRNPYSEVPCYRVVCTDGAIGGYSAPGGSATKARKLRADGLEVKGLQVVGLQRYVVRLPRLGKGIWRGGKKVRRAGGRR
jgi:methylated-DNA-[protein]-cysteine S-methyltransferase